MEIRLRFYKPGASTVSRMKELAQAGHGLIVLLVVWLRKISHVNTFNFNEGGKDYHPHNSSPFNQEQFK